MPTDLTDAKLAATENRSQELHCAGMQSVMLSQSLQRTERAVMFGDIFISNGVRGSERV